MPLRRGRRIGIRLTTPSEPRSVCDHPTFQESLDAVREHPSGRVCYQVVSHEEWTPRGYGSVFDSSDVDLVQQG